MIDSPVNHEPSLSEALDTYRRVCRYCDGQEVLDGFGVPCTAEHLMAVYGEPSDELRLRYRKRVVDAFYKMLDG